MSLIVVRAVHLLEEGGFLQQRSYEKGIETSNTDMKGKDGYGYRVAPQSPRGQWDEDLPRGTRKRTFRTLYSGRYGGWRPLREGGRAPRRRVYRRHLRSAWQLAQPPARRMGGNLDRGALGGRGRVDRIPRACPLPRLRE